MLTYNKSPDGGDTECPCHKVDISVDNSNISASDLPQHLFDPS